MLRRCTVALAFVLCACGAADAVESDDSVPPTAVPTIPGVGALPDTIPVPTLDDSAEEPIASVVVTRPVDDDGVVAESVAERVNGNRLLVIGDSILASTATRYGGELCEALNPIGWSVEVDAEPGRPVRFGNEVAEARLDVGDEADDFDAVVIHLGSNYGRDRAEYYEQLSELLYRAAPRPTLLLTVTEYRPQWSEVNDVIDELARLYDNVTIVDWEKIARAPGVLSRDGLHPGNQGEAVLVEQIAVALGELGTEEGECLRSSFTDDSAIGRGDRSGGSSGSSSGGSSSGGSSSGGSSSGSSSGGSSSGGSSGGTTAGATDSTGGTTTNGSTTGGTTGGDTGTATTGSADDTTTGGTTGETTGGTTGETTGGTTGETTGGTTGTTGGSTTGDAATGGTSGTTGGSTTGGSTTDSTTGGSTSGGSTSGGSTTGGSTTGGSTTDSTTGGSTSGGSTTDSTTGGSTDGTAATGGTDSGGGEG